MGLGEAPLTRSLRFGRLVPPRRTTQLREYDTASRSLTLGRRDRHVPGVEFDKRPLLRGTMKRNTIPRRTKVLLAAAGF